MSEVGSSHSSLVRGFCWDWWSLLCSSKAPLYPASLSVVAGPSARTLWPYGPTWCSCVHFLADFLSLFSFPFVALKNAVPKSMGGKGKNLSFLKLYHWLPACTYLKRCDDFINHSLPCCVGSVWSGIWLVVKILFADCSCTEFSVSKDPGLTPKKNLNNKNP